MTYFDDPSGLDFLAGAVSTKDGGYVYSGEFRSLEVRPRAIEQMKVRRGTALGQAMLDLIHHVINAPSYDRVDLHEALAGRVCIVTRGYVNGLVMHPETPILLHFDFGAAGPPTGGGGEDVGPARGMRSIRCRSAISEGAEVSLRWRDTSPDDLQPLGGITPAGLERDLILSLLQPRERGARTIVLRRHHEPPVRVDLLFHAVAMPDSRLLRFACERRSGDAIWPPTAITSAEAAVAWRSGKSVVRAGGRVGQILAFIRSLGYGSCLWGGGLRRGVISMARDPAWTLVEVDAFIGQDRRLVARITSATLEGADSAVNRTLRAFSWTAETASRRVGPGRPSNNPAPWPDGAAVRLLALVRRFVV